MLSKPTDANYLSVGGDVYELINCSVHHILTRDLPSEVVKPKSNSLKGYFRKFDMLSMRRGAERAVTMLKAFAVKLNRCKTITYQCI